MKATALHPSQSPPAGIADEARALYVRMQRDTFVRTDRIFGLLMILQWLAGIVLAFVVSPRTWIGEASATHLHVYAAVLLGGLISLVPAALAFRRPGAPYTRYAIAAGQVLTSGLLIHLTGGRIETHFHIFASLGLLAAYRDWKVIIVAAAVTAADHLLRGLVYPESIFGVTTADVWRVVEHAWWVVFMVLFLLKADRESVKEQRALAETQARANAMNAQNEELLRKAEAQQARLTEQSTELQEAMTVLDTQQRYLQENVELMRRQMAAFADGNLAVHLPTDREGAVRTLFEGFNQAVQNIRETLDHVNQIVETTAASASQISSFTEELAAASQQQSAQAQEVAAAVEEMARTIVDNAQNASRTAAVAQENGRQAQEGSEVVRLTVEKISRIADVVRSSGQTIERLGDSSQEIGEIISVIDEIANQTNLLALNAAIEAARAGDQGRGFAVVADEVRKLAERTTSATRQITEMINTIQADTRAAVQAMQEGNREVEEGIQLADQARAALERIVAGVQETMEVITQIAAASEQQSATSEEIARSVEAISAVSAESADGIGHIARGADELSNETHLLRQLLSRFRFDAPAPSSGTPPAASRSSRAASVHSPQA